MGGPGSGSGYRWRARSTVEGCRSIDIRRWRKLGYIPGPSRFSWQWSYEGERTADINVRTIDRDETILSFRSRNYGEDEWESVEQRIPIDWTACNLGGERPWFRCSAYRNGIYCGRRVAKLYGAGKLFACRHCYDLAYQSQHEPPYGRALLKTQKISERLGGSSSLAEPFPGKPKGMHWRTYGRLCVQASEAEHSSWMGAAERFGISF